MARRQTARAKTEEARGARRAMKRADASIIAKIERDRIVELLRHWASNPPGPGCTFATPQQEGMWQAANAIASGATKEAGR